MPARSHKERGLKPKNARQAATQFKPGNSLGGRKHGSVGKAAELKRKIETAALKNLSSKMPSLMDKAVEMGLAGDSAMLKFCIERFIPKATVEEIQSGGAARITINVASIEPPVIEGEIDGR